MKQTRTITGNQFLLSGTVGKNLHIVITGFIASVWLVNGLFCKVLHLVPRHELIVARILGNDHARTVTVFIGIAEIIMAVWILTAIKPRLCSIAQIVAVAIMNSIEFFLSPDLLLWGKFNSVFALMFIVLIGYHEFYSRKKSIQTNTLPKFLKNHPFAVEAFFERSIVITFAVPKEQLQHVIPECLTLDTFNEKWGFIAVAMVQTKGLRPKGFPLFTGNDFFLVGYRVFVKYRNNAGRNLRGLYILGSETDKKRMELMGNTFTHYNYRTIDITQIEMNDITEIKSEKSGFRITIDTSRPDITLPPKSPFNNWKEARRFAGPLPFTFTYNANNNQVLTIEGVRQNWQPKPVHVSDHQFPFLDSLHLENRVLANAFMVENIPYYWKKGKTELWKKEENPSRVY